jgi:hypothetical protein
MERLMNTVDDRLALTLKEIRDLGWPKDCEECEAMGLECDLDKVQCRCTILS